MAYIDSNKKNSKSNTKGNKGEKKGLAAKYKSVRAELKKVIWLDRKHLKQNFVVVLAIILSTALIIFVFDALVKLFFDAIGFYKPKSGAALPNQVTSSQPLMTETKKAADESSENETGVTAEKSEEGTTAAAEEKSTAAPEEAATTAPEESGK